MLDNVTNRIYQVWMNHPRVNAELKTALMDMDESEIKEVFKKAKEFI